MKTDTSRKAFRVAKPQLGLSALPKFAVLADASPTGATTNGDAVVDVNGQEFKSPRDLGNVIVQVFVNKSGLGQTLVTVGWLGLGGR